MSRPKADTTPIIAAPLENGEALVDQFEALKSAVFEAGKTATVSPLESEDYPQLNGQGLFVRLFSLDERISYSKFVRDHGDMYNNDASVNHAILLGISNENGERIFKAEQEIELKEEIARLHPLFRLELWRKVLEFNNYLDKPKQVAAKK